MRARKFCFINSQLRGKQSHCTHTHTLDLLLVLLLSSQQWIFFVPTFIKLEKGKEFARCKQANIFLQRNFFQLEKNNKPSEWESANVRRDKFALYAPIELQSAGLETFLLCVSQVCRPTNSLCASSWTKKSRQTQKQRQTSAQATNTNESDTSLKAAAGELLSCCCCCLKMSQQQQHTHSSSVWLLLSAIQKLGQ